MLEHPLNIKFVNTTTDFDGSSYGKFIIEPFERGYGTTLGNALRRVLLSGLLGCAITSVKIEGVSHEFTTIPNVKEDVLDILLNLKGVVLKNTASDLTEAKTLRLTAKKAGPVTAGDLEVPSDIVVINPDWVICNLSEGGSISMELTAQVGKGYVPAEQHQDGKTHTVESLYIDAVYMPIRRVSYMVDNTRVGQRVDYDKLVLEVWSNGSIDVSTAVSQASNLLIEHLLPIASLSGSPSVMLQAAAEPVAEAIKDPGIAIEDLELSVRAYNCLKRANIHTMTELLQKSELDLLNIKNFGKKSADEVIERLHANNLNLQPNPEGVELPVEEGAY